MRLRERLGVDERRQRQLTRSMQVALVGILAVGLYRADPGITVNAGLALAVTYLPALLERDHHIPMDAGLTLWLTGAVFLHALGTVGLPGAGSFYTSVSWWDHLTHGLSASVVAGVGYTVARALDVHTDAVRLPPRFMFVFVLLFVLAFGVLWEVLEFAVGGYGFLTQYGIEDTLLDLVFDTLGGLVVALWGTAHLSDVVDALASRLERSGT